MVFRGVAGVLSAARKRTTTARRILEGASGILKIRLGEGEDDRAAPKRRRGAVKGRNFGKIPEWNHGKSMRHLRQRAAIRQQYFARAQRDAAAMEPQPAGGEGAGERRAQAAAGVRKLHQEREGRQGVGAAPGDRGPGLKLEGKASPSFADGLGAFAGNAARGFERKTGRGG